MSTQFKCRPVNAVARAEGPGIIDRIAVREGQKVRQGDVLATLRLSGIQPDQAAAEAQIAQAQARLTEIERGGHSAELAEIENGLRVLLGGQPRVEQPRVEKTVTQSGGTDNLESNYLVENYDDSDEEK